MDVMEKPRQTMQQALSQWQKDGQSLLKGATALGIDTGGYVAPFGGTTPRRTPTTRAGGTRARGRRGAHTGPTLTDEQILAFLREHGPGNQSTLAKQFGTTRQTIAKRLEPLTKAGIVVREGSVWHVKDGGSA
jgi:hypothetical protein